jgi:hypothetical protein
MKRNRQPSTQTAAVLLALGEDSTAWRYGYELCQETGLKAGSMYPILMRLADRGLLETNCACRSPAAPPVPADRFGIRTGVRTRRRDIPRRQGQAVQIATADGGRVVKNGLFDIRRSVIVGHFVAGGRRLV